MESGCGSSECYSAYENLHLHLSECVSSFYSQESLSFYDEISRVCGEMPNGMDRLTEKRFIRF